MTRSEARVVVQLLLCVSGALLISAAGVVLTMATGSQVVGWLLVPGGMLALANMNEYAGLWVYGGLVLNVTTWSIIVYAVGDQIAERRRRHRAAGV